MSLVGRQSRRGSKLQWTHFYALLFRIHFAFYHSFFLGFWSYKGSAFSWRCQKSSFPRIDGKSPSTLTCQRKALSIFLHKCVSVLTHSLHNSLFFLPREVTLASTCFCLFLSLSLSFSLFLSLCFHLSFSLIFYSFSRPLYLPYFLFHHLPLSILFYQVLPFLFFSSLSPSQRQSSLISLFLLKKKKTIFKKILKNFPRLWFASL